LRRRELLAAVHGFHQTIQKVSDVGFRAVNVAFICEFDCLSFSSSVVVGIAAIISTKEGGASLDDLPGLFAPCSIAPKKLCNTE
jgi:hypothetical protein